MSTNLSLINPNQFAPTATAGLCLNPSHGQRIEAEYYPAGDTTINVCTPCKFVAGANKANISADAIAADTEIPTAGILIYDSSKRNSYTKGQYMTLARVGSIVLLTASAAITANQSLSIAANGKVATAAATKNVIGIAMNSVGRDELVRVLLVEPYVMAAGG